MVLVVGGIWHETNTFSPVRTDFDAFHRFQFVEGAAIPERLGDTNSEIGGMLRAAAELGVEVVATVQAGAVPSGLVARSALDTLIEVICRTVRETASVDGVVLALHGAMVAEGLDQADAHVLVAVRAALGPDKPIVASFDSHANLTADFVAGADLLVGYDTLPHVDMGARGAEAMACMDRILREGRRPHMAFRKLPLLSTPDRQATGESPMREVMALCHELEVAADVWCASVVLGFPYADVPHLGMASLAYADSQARAEEVAEAIAAEIWTRREAFRPALSGPAAAVERALAAPRGPVVLIEPSDNVAGGAPGDGTGLLAALAASPALAGRSASIAIWDPAAVATAREVGLDGRFEGPIGGKTLALAGAPVEIAGSVGFLGPVVYRRDRDYFRGQEIDLGEVARIEVCGLHVILTTERLMPFDTMHLRAVGLEPEALDLIAMKCGSMWRVAFGDIAAEGIYVDTPGVCTSNLASMPYTRLVRSMYPLDPEARR